ncbi:hypothetical protein MRX96_027953 [Rhipicephalus microplus]
MFDAAFSPDIQQLLHRARTESGGKYPPELRTFALTLHFYSPAAYEFVRSKFNDALPSQRTIREWYRSVDGQPGFTGEAFSFLEKLVQGRSETLYCALIVDDMSIRKHVELVGDRVVGYVDFGASLDDDSLPEATNVCVYIVVGINMRLKIPVGYFLIHSLTGSERAELTKQCIERLESVKVQVVSLTFDGASSNFTMAKCLGAELKPDPVEFSTSFKNPVDESRDVHILLDPCHMIKLIRNSLATMCYITDVDGNHIKWAYIKALEALQREEGLRLGNKLTKVHMQWEKQKMKVRLAVQALSASVADALEFCEQTLKLPQFRGASATAKFVRVFDHLFDLLNSRNAFAKSYKAPLRKQNEPCWKQFFADAREYICALKDPFGRPLLQGTKRTGFVGFLVCIQSTESIFKELVHEGQLNYLLTHKMSQDHAETFFGCVRGRGGFNNNPTAAQFMAAYKRLLVQTEVRSSTSGNCSQDIVSILGASASATTFCATTEVTSRRCAILQPEDHDYTDRIDYPESLSTFVCSVVPYIAGFVARKIATTNTCELCIEALHGADTSLLVRQKNRGGLFYPSEDVVSLCETAEKGLRRLQASTQCLKNIHANTKQLVLEILSQSLEKRWFSQLEQHLFDVDVLDNHIYNLSKQVLELYIKIRLHHMTKERSRELVKDKVRSLLSRLVIFRNQ